MKRKSYVKICCIGSIEETCMAIDSGTMVLGLGHLCPAVPVFHAGVLIPDKA